MEKMAKCLIDSRFKNFTDPSLIPDYGFLECMCDTGRSNKK